MASGRDSIIENAPPELFTPPAVVINSGESIDLSLQANDPDDDKLTFSVSGLPSGIVMDPNGRFSGSSQRDGNYTITARVTDGLHTTSSTWLWQVQGEQGRTGLGGLSWLTVFFLLCLMPGKRVFRNLH